jgi:hypothetical protein
MNAEATHTTQTANVRVPNHPVAEAPLMPFIPPTILLHSDPIALSVINQMGVPVDPEFPISTPISSDEPSDYLVEVTGSATSVDT